jgi:hypothetical protein
MPVMFPLKYSMFSYVKHSGYFVFDRSIILLVELDPQFRPCWCRFNLYKQEASYPHQHSKDGGGCATEAMF